MKTSAIFLYALLGLASSAQVALKHARRLDGVFPSPRDVLSGDVDVNSSSSTSSSSDSAATTSADSAAASPSSAPSSTSDSSKAIQTTQPQLTTTPQTTPSSVTQQSIPDSQSTTAPSSSTSSTSPTSSTSSTTSTTPTGQSTTSGFRTTSIALHTFISTANGVLTTDVSTSSFIITPSSTALASDSSSNDSALSNKTRSTIIGIVCGIAGAVVLGSLILMARRIFAGRRNRVLEDDGMMEYNGFNGGMANREKELHSAGGSVGTGSTPFQSTLESYHNPVHGRNVSSNF